MRWYLCSSYYHWQSEDSKFEVLVAFRCEQKTGESGKGEGWPGDSPLDKGHRQPYVLGGVIERGRQRAEVCEVDVAPHHQRPRGPQREVREMRAWRVG